MSKDILNVGASCVTGATVIAITNPLDCLKQRWQVTRAGGSMLAFTRDIFRAEGLFRGLWLPGIFTNCMACTISVGTRIGVYPRLRDQLSLTTGHGTKSMFLSGLAGGAFGYVMAAPLFFATRVAQAEAGLVVDGVLTTGARAGLAPSAAGAGGLGMLHHLWASGGTLGLWKGAGVLVARGALMSSTQLATYDQAKRQMQGAGLSDGPLVHSAASVAASLVLTTAICPLDVVLTNYQSGPSVGRHYASAWAAASNLVQTDGPLALMRGWLPLWARFLPSSFLTFHIFEQTRRMLIGKYLD